MSPAVPNTMPSDTKIAPHTRSNMPAESWSERLMTFATASHLWACVLLIVLALCAFLPGFASLQPMDRDEPRFAQATKQMLETGDFVAIRFQDEARNKKPVGIHWLQAATVSAGEALGVPEARTTIWLYRLPSLAGALAMVLITYWAALGMVGRREAFLAAAFMAAAILLGVEARLAKTDAVLSACCVVIMGGLARAWLREKPLSTGTIIGFWIAMALAILVKGPIAPMVAGLAALALSIKERSGRWLLPLRPWLGLAIVLAAVLPWFVAIAIKTQGAFFAEAVGKDMLGKVGGGQERHWGPPGAYLLVFFGTFWPVAALAAMAIPSMWSERRAAVVAFCLAWIVPAWLVFEVVPTKLPHYVLPLYPAIAILTARAIGQRAFGPWRPGAIWVVLLIPFIPLGLLIGLGYAGWRLDHTLPIAGLAVLAISTALGIWAWTAFRHDDLVRTAFLGIAASLVAAIGVYGFVQPVLRALQISPRLAAAAHQLSCKPLGATAGYREPSLVFLIGTGLEMVDGAGAASFLAQPGCRIVFVTAQEQAGFAAEAARIGLAPKQVETVHGFNINGGKPLDIAIYAKTD